MGRPLRFYWRVMFPPDLIWNQSSSNFFNHKIKCFKVHKLCYYYYQKFIYFSTEILFDFALAFNSSVGYSVGYLMIPA